ncbi:hypothetical protein NIES593_19810 [Hydrococcus rivularis NIES-593]|uniref:DUF924 domain-containing protein n=1 Tax=Hydrococcus rivularis NIES-593 TaxID=1921803 RepID=A0A1U7H978_9CYAN|nr:DUF924 family protein [Hydrococcus rivularis]OKH20139.1 hypothetical protein NIES593_19810 [Hydrococcus rivularis NIES-593]
MQFEDILEFWFGKPKAANYGKLHKEWFIKNINFDKEVRSRFLETYQKAASGKLNSWQESPLSCLALIIVLDQFPRNMFRDKPQAFATDELALKFAKYACDRDFDKELLSVQRWFIYCPFEHSENLEDQQKAVELFSTLKDDPDSASAIDYAYRHLEVIKRFGRFPHRNKILGRQSTPEEEEFLKQPGSSF